MSHRSVVVLVTALLVPTLLSAQAQDTGRVVNGQLVTDTFEIDHQWEGDTLLLSVRSDLPDDATVMVSVDRHYWEQGASDTYVLSYLSERSTVGIWENRTHRVVIDDEQWRKDLRAKQRKLAGTVGAFQVRRIEDSVHVGFTVPVNQDDPRFGKANSNLVGDAVRKTGLRVVREEMALANPLGGQPSPSPWVGPEDLEVEGSYEVGARTPLMPSFEPRDPLADAAAAVQMPAGSHITVREVRFKDGTPWYRVEAVDPRGESLGTGWVNSTALIGQEVKRTSG